MRAPRHVFCCLAILSTIPLCQATPSDPQVSIGDPATGTLLNSGNWAFQADANGGGMFNFTNNTRQTWQTLDFFATLPSGDTISCSSTVFTVCSFTETNSGRGSSVFDVGFEDPATGPGISPGGSFTVDLDTVAGIDRGGWEPNNTIRGVANFELPEPGSWTLAALGFLVLGAGAIYRRAL